MQYFGHKIIWITLSFIQDDSVSVIPVPAEHKCYIFMTAVL